MHQEQSLQLISLRSSSSWLRVPCSGAFRDLTGRYTVSPLPSHVFLLFTGQHPADEVENGFLLVSMRFPWGQWSFRINEGFTPRVLSFSDIAHTPPHPLPTQQQPCKPCGRFYALWWLMSCLPAGVICALMVIQLGVTNLWTTCPSSQLPIYPEPFVQTAASWLLVTWLPQADRRAKRNRMSHLQGEQRSPLLCGNRKSAPGDELMTPSSFIMLKASQRSFSFVFGHSTEPETGKEKSEDIRHPWEAWRWQWLVDMGPWLS